jgi:alpha-L-fucosidase
VIEFLAVLAIQMQRPKPTPAQLAWHKLEMVAFVHFGPNTFTNREWGEGKEDPRVFRPTQFNPRQWASVAKAAGMKGLILTAKHHDGFCLWPSQYSQHTVREAGFGRDVVGEVAAACREYGLKFGVYLSPWDRNHPAYGTDAYNDVFVNTLTEVLTKYGPVFEVWFDGANGEGPNGKRQVYDWQRFIQTVRKHQPNAVIFSDAGPDIRWVGNEQGIASETHWYTLNRDRYVPGTPYHQELGEGQENGTHYVPAECDVSIRPGWFYHPEQDDQVRSPKNLMELYEKSVGRGSNLLLNLPVDRRGLVHENDVAALQGFRKLWNATYAKPISTQLTIAAEALSLKATKSFDRVLLQEDVRNGQQVKRFVVEVLRGGTWHELAIGTTVGHKRIVPVPVTEPGLVRVRAWNSESSVLLQKASIHATDAVAHEQRMKWWREARFGMFIHWGLYAVPAGTWKDKNFGGASEWLMNNAQVSTAEWEPLLRQFNPTKYDPKEWVQIAKSAGMKYIVITSKHHEGFSLWPSKEGDFHVGLTPYRKDLLKPLAEECKKAGIKLGFYYSILDWHHPDYLPRTAWDSRNPNSGNVARYKTFLRAQLKELLTAYLETAVLWFDGEWESTWTHQDGLELYDFVRSLSPNILINNRVDKGRSGMQGLTKSGGFAGDFGTPEQEIPGNGIPGVDWESCMTMNNSWGFHAKDQDWKSARTLIQNLIDCASKGGNYLLNVGPTGLGEIPPASVERLRVVGNWLKNNGDSVYGTTAGPYAKPPRWGRVTRKGQTLFAHVFDDRSSEVELTGIRGRLLRARTMHGEVVTLRRRNAEWVVEVPAGSEEVRTVAIDFDGDIRVERMLSELTRNGIELLGDEAETSHGIRFESEKNALGFWTNREGEVRWAMRVASVGKYALSLQYACDPASAGSTVEVSVGGETRTFLVQATKSWSDFAIANLGEIHLVTPGEAEVRVRVKSMPNGAVMNLRSVKLSAVP